MHKNHKRKNFFFYDGVQVGPIARTLLCLIVLSHLSWHWLCPLKLEVPQRLQLRKRNSEEFPPWQIPEVMFFSEDHFIGIVLPHGATQLFMLFFSFLFGMCLNKEGFTAVKIWRLKLRELQEFLHCCTVNTCQNRRSICDAVQCLLSLSGSSLS